MTISQDMLRRLDDLHICHSRCHSGHLCRALDKDHSRHEFGCAEHALSRFSNRIVVDRDCTGSWGELENWGEVSEVSREEAVADRLRSCLGLTPWETFRKQRVEMNKVINLQRNTSERRYFDLDRHRGTGRTTRGIVTAIADCLVRQVQCLMIESRGAISIYCLKITQDFIEQLGLQIDVKIVNSNGFYAIVARNVVVYDDHTYEEHQL